MDRDKNSTINILTRYFARLGPHTQELECGVLHSGNLEVEVTGTSQVA
jgi:putative transposase